jgi:hypothetical protein
MDVGTWVNEFTPLVGILENVFFYLTGESNILENEEV